MTRHQVASLAAGSAAILAVVTGHGAVAVMVILGLLVLIGFGAALPRMRFFGPFVCSGDRSRRRVALTFDDGPDPRSTPALLDLLRESEVQAAFFCVGQRVGHNPGLAARIVGEGHLLGNHSHEHSVLTNVFSSRRLEADLARTQEAVQKATGTVPVYFRPPIGLSNPRVFRVARRLGLMVVGWTARGLDTLSTSPNRIVARIERGLKPGCIILLHDGNVPAERLLPTVKLLLDRLRELEYEVVRLDVLLK